MVCRCFCRTCAGRTVDRRTFVRHGRVSEPVPEPPAKRACDGIHLGRDPGAVNLVEPAAAVFESTDDELDSDADEADNDVSRILMDEPVSEQQRRAAGAGPALLTRDEITVLFVDWMSSYKLTDKAAAAALQLFRALIPENCDMATFAQVTLRECMCTRHNVHAVT